MYIAVCDDQAEDLNDIDAFLCEWESKRNHPLHRKLFSNMVELLDAARRENFTLYLLDVIMSGIDGMSAAQELRDFDRTADIIFLTSSPEFAWESYRVQALDYLLKPVDKGTLEIKNPYVGQLTFRDGLPETARPGHGCGCRSIQAIVERNRGLCEFKAENGIFTLRVALLLL